MSEGRARSEGLTPTPTPAATSAARRRFDAATRALTGYQFVVFVVVVVVVAARLSGGGFVADRRTELAAPKRVAPFVPVRNETKAPAAAPTTIPPRPGVTLPLGSSASSPGADDGTAATTTTTTTAPPPPPFDDHGYFGQTFVFADTVDPGKPTAVAVGAAGEVWVGTDTSPPRLLGYDPHGSVVASYTPAGVSGGVTALRLARDGRLYAAVRNPAVVITVDPATGAIATYATIPDGAPCLRPAGLVAGCAAPTALAFDAKGALFVADAAQGAVWKVPPGGGAPQRWLSEPTWAVPDGAGGLSGLAFDGAGNLVLLQRSTVTDDTGRVHLLAVAADGAPGARTSWAMGAGSAPSGVALGESGKLYVSLTGFGYVAVLAPDGVETARLPADGTLVDTPMGIAFRGQSVLVASREGAQVLRYPVGEAGGLLYW